MPTADVSAIVLSLGEPTVARAIDSVRRQTAAVADIIVVEGVAPFHRAINDAAARVTTPYFVQVDADMVLDADCVAHLRRAAAAGVGIVLGYLRDPLYGPIQGVKLFRRECFVPSGMPDSVSPDTDFYREVDARGWQRVIARRDTPADEPHTFGEHRPDYDNPLYVFRKFAIEGRRWHYRGDAAALRHRLSLLAASAHPQALLAQIALGYGALTEGDADQLKPYVTDAAFERAMALLADSPADATPAGRRFALPLRSWLSPRAAFAAGREIGGAAAHAGNRAAIAAALRRRHALHPFDWLVQVGFCRGLLADAAADDADGWGRLAVFHGYYEPAGLLRRLRARARELMHFRR